MPPIDNELGALEIEKKSDSHESEVVDSRERVLEALARFFENLERGEVSIAHTRIIPELQPGPGRLISSRYLLESDYHHRFKSRIASKLETVLKLRKQPNPSTNLARILEMTIIRPVYITF
jgi:hypothetical protein